MMTDYINYTNKYIENKIGLNLRTLNSFSIGEHKKYSDIYSLTSHEYRYSTLSAVLKIMAIPLVVVSNAIKILSCEIVAVKEMINIPLILLKEMDQGISKKILHGLDGTNEDELCGITSNILEQWKEDNTLIPQEEQYLIKKITKEIFKTAYIAGKEANSLNSDDIYNHFKDIGAYKDNTPSKEIDLVQKQWFHNNYDAWDVSYLNNDDTAHLIGDEID